MRSLLLIFGTFLVLAGGFFAYLWFQPAPGGSGTSGGTPAPVAEAIAPASRPVEMPDPDRIAGGGESKNIWVKVRDEKTGELSNEFRAERFEPRKNSSIVDVAEPEAKFYLGEHDPRQVLVIRGKTGTVVVPDSPNKRGQLKSASAAAPTSGQLKDVSILLFDNADATEPALVCTMNNASFDQETFRIQTDSYEHNGKTIPGDQVPVQVRGRDYDFDGRGLDIRWNERDRRLKQLLITHGEKLLVKHPQAIRSLNGPTTAPSAVIARPWSLASSRLEAAIPIMLAAADPAAAGQAINAPAPVRKRKKTTAPVIPPVKIARDKSIPIFRATFSDNVKILEGDATIATAKNMHVDFMMDSSKVGTTQPTTMPTSATEPPQPKPVPTPRLPRTRPSASPNARGSAAGPATQPVDQPLTILWTGKLLVAPLETEPENLPGKDDQIVTLDGAPVMLNRSGSNVECALVRYRTKDSSVYIESEGPTKPIVLSDVNGSVLRTEKLNFDGDTNLAVLSGKSRADMVLPAEPTTRPADPTAPPPAPKIVHASWTKSCELQMAGESKESMTITSADIDGDVTIDHPQIKGRSESLSLDFEQVWTVSKATDRGGQSIPKLEPQIRELDADGGVHYVVTSDGKSQTLDCGHLQLQTDVDQNQKLYARTMSADGSVHAFDDQQDLKSENLSLTFAPSPRAATTKPAKETGGMDMSGVVIEGMVAQKDVQISTKDGNFATANRLEMKTLGGQRQIELMGAPLAKLQQKDNTLIGPIIRFYPDTNQADVVGAGAMHVLQEPAVKPGQPPATKKPQPFDMTWAGNLKANGNTNSIDITDKIALDARTSDGAQNNATADKLHLTLKDDPKAATRPATTQKSKKQDSALASAGFGDSTFFKDKIVDTVQLEQDVKMKSVLNDSTGNLMRRAYMAAPIVQYQMQDKVFCVPVPGQMLVQDVSKPEKSDKSAPALGAEPSVNDMHGATAFEWFKELRYDESQKLMTMRGDVRIVHDSGADSRPFTLRAQLISAELEPVPTTQPSTTPANASDFNEKMRLKHVSATDSVEFISLPHHFEAASIEYDPNTHILIARGTDRVRAELYDDKGDVQGTFTELRYNTQTGQIEQTIGMRGTVRR